MDDFIEDLKSKKFGELNYFEQRVVTKCLLGKKTPEDVEKACVRGFFEGVKACEEMLEQARKTSEELDR